jgi:hypothetical protein
MSSDNKKIITTTYIDALLNRLYKWMPFKRKNEGIVQDSLDESGVNTLEVTNKNEIALGSYNKSNQNTVLSVGVGTSDADRRNAIEIRKDGMIYIITDIKTNSIESLQNALAKKGTTICTTYDEVSNYISKDNIGQLIYISENITYDGGEYTQGLYVVGNSSMDVPVLTKLGTTSSSSVDLSQRVDELEIRIGNLEDFESRIQNIENWIDEPILLEEIENITKQDLNDNSIIGK